MKSSFFYLLLCIALVACNRKVAVNTSTLPSNSKIENTSPIITETPVIEKPTTVPLVSTPYVVSAIKKTPCYGQCSAFEAKFFSDGRVSWYGKKHTDRMGHYEAFITPEQLATIQLEVNQQKYFSLAESYPVDGKMIPDLPQTITSVNMGKDAKTIINQYDAPLALQAYEAYLIEMLEKLNWIQVK